MLGVRRTEVLVHGVEPGQQLAESLEPNAKATKWTLRLKEGIHFHDGKPLTADDVVYTVRRIIDPKAPAGWERYESAGGVKGYMKGRDDALNLSLNHVCFAKVKGKYRITAVFGYGL